MPQLVDHLSDHADTRGVVSRRLGTILSEPALKLADGNPEQVCKRLLWGGEGLGGPGENLPDGSVIVVRLIFDDVPGARSLNSQSVLFAGSHQLMLA